MPALYKALDSLKSLKKDHFIEVKTFSVAPGGVLLTMEALCMFFDVAPLRKNDPNKIGAKIIDYWQPAKD
jgi:dynein heavy chain